MRLRQHTNPFSYRGRYDGPAPETLLGGPPTELEIGPGFGELLVARALEAPQVRLLGIEVRSAYVEICQEALHEAGVTNAVAIYAEARADVPDLVEDASLDRIYLMFPDPWFKRRHHKRRVLDQPFAELLTDKLRLGAELHFATDNRALGEELRQIVENVERLEGLGQLPKAAALSGRGEHHMGKGHAIYGDRYRRRC